MLQRCQPAALNRLVERRVFLDVEFLVLGAVIDGLGFGQMCRKRGGKRQEIVDLTGQQDVPVLVTDDGSIIAGSQAIVAWARELRPA